MLIKTQNHGGRSIVRADRAMWPNYFGYWRMGDGQPSLQCRIDGFDGKQYTVIISEQDLQAMNKARNEIYADAFKR